MPTAVLSLLVALAAATATTPPAPSRWVEDGAAFLSPATRTALDGRLEGYQNATKHQVIVWIGKTLDGAPLDDWSVRTFAAWKIGRKGIDDGLAMFIFADDRTVDIEVGYGLEGKVPDAIASRVIRDVMTPRLRAGDRDGAVTAGVDALLAAIEGQPWTGAAATAPEPVASYPTPWYTWLLGGLGVLALLFFVVTHPRLALMLLWTVASGGRGGSGGGGGFSGGGGRSGGGGARGKW